MRCRSAQARECLSAGRVIVEPFEVLVDDEIWFDKLGLAVLLDGGARIDARPEMEQALADLGDDALLDDNDALPFRVTSPIYPTNLEVLVRAADLINRTVPAPAVAVLRDAPSCTHQRHDASCGACFRARWSGERP